MNTEQESAALDALRPLVEPLPPDEREAAARRVLRYLEIVMEIVDEENGWGTPGGASGDGPGGLTATDEGSTLSHSV